MSKIAGPLLFLALLYSGTINGQRHVERHWNYQPFQNSIDSSIRGVEWMPKFSGWTEFGKFVSIKDTNHEYHHQLGAIMEIARWGRNSIAIGTQAEFLHNRNNSINFNPRAVFWEEGLIYTRHYKDHSWQLTYFHRCKHDLDNLEIGVERATINASLGTRWIIPKHDWLGGHITFIPMAEAFTVTYDRRLREQYQQKGLSWYQLLGAVSGRFHWEKAINSDLWYFVKGHGKLAFFGNGAEDGADLDTYTRFNGYEDERFSGNLFTGVQVNGKAGKFRIGVRYEYLDDPGISPIPRNSSLLSLTAQAFTRDRLF